MKILILTQNVNMTIVNQGLNQAKQKLTSIGFPVEFTIKETARKFSSVYFSSATQPAGYEVNPNEILAEEKVYGDFEVDCLIYDETKITPKPTNPADNAEVMQIPQNWFVTYPEVLCDFFLHELCHERFWATGKPDITHNYDPAFSQKPRAEWYLFLLKGMLPTIVPVPPPTPTTPSPYKWFSPAEVVMWKLIPALWQKLDEARGIAGVPFRITSGLRSIAQNQAVGGKVNSAHLTGEACDLACSDASTRWLIMNALLKVGFNRLEVASAHIHADISKTLPQNIIDFSSEA